MKLTAWMMAALTVLAAATFAAGAPQDPRVPPFQGNLIYVGRDKVAMWSLMDIAGRIEPDCRTVWVVNAFFRDQPGKQGPMSERRLLVKFCHSNRTARVLAKAEIGPRPKSRIYGVEPVREPARAIAPQSLWDKTWRKVFALKLDCLHSCLRRCVPAADEFPPPGPVAACLKKHLPPAGLRPQAPVPEGLARLCRAEWRAICRTKCRTECARDGR